MKTFLLLFAATTAVTALSTVAQTAITATNADHPFYYTTTNPVPVVNPAPAANLDEQNHWVVVSNYFKTNFVLSGTNVTPSFSNWASTNNVYAQTPAPRWNSSNAWLAFSNWVQTNNFASSTAYTNTTLTPTGRTATNATPSLEKRLRDDFKDVKDEVHDLFRKKTNSP